MRIEHLRQRLRALGANPRHEQRVLRLWSQALPQDAGRREIGSFLPSTLVAALPALSEELAGLARLVSEHPGEDGSARLLVALPDGQTVESVLLPRDGLCVSTQVGCAVGCVFCMTGTTGLIRQVGSAEIVAQVALARTLRPVKKVVFMGMGEPAHNLDNVMEAIDLLGIVGNIGHKNLVFSTVGDPRVFEALPQGRVKPALALSLHTTRADLRSFSPVRNREAKGPVPHNIGHFFLAIDPLAFRDAGEFEQDVDGVIDVLTGSRPSQAGRPVLVAGGPERAARQERERSGIPLPETLLAQLRAIADNAGVPFGFGSV